MAGNLQPNLQNRFRDIINLPIPNLSGDNEKLFISLFVSFATNNEVANAEVIQNGIHELVVEMSTRLGRFVSALDIRFKIIQLRHGFASFRRFLGLPRVFYFEESNLVTVQPQYFLNIPNAREPLTWRAFRLEGLPNYSKLKFIFMSKHCSLLSSEPRANLWIELPPREGDEVA